jgi:anaerobic magnesium-protoporphyrin IX monomethyl ester cyclase
MARILFGQSYYLRFDPKLWKAMQPYPPLGTMYAASYLRSRGYEVALFDAMLAESESEWQTALDAHKPEFAILFEDNFNYLSKMCLLRMREAAITMISMAKSRGCVVIAAGADMTDHSDLYLEKGADFVLLGEGEETLAELMDSLTGRSLARPDTIIGVRSKRITQPTRRPDIRALDSLPFPAWDLVDVDRYRRIWLERHGSYSMNMVTTRGCPYHCNWCAKPIWGQRYNSRSPENVAQELAWLQQTYRPDHIWFADDIMGLKPGWLELFADLVKALPTPFKCLQRADLVTEATAAALRQAGCQTVWLGAESGSQKILDAMEKGDKVEDIYRAAHLLHQNGLEVGFFLQFGFPGEGWADIQSTLKMVRDCRPDDIGISVSYPLPGTKFHERVRMELGDKQNWVDSEDLAMLYKGPYPTEFYRVLHARVHHEFRLRRAWSTRDVKKVLRTPYYLVGIAKTNLQLSRLGRQAQPSAGSAFGR